LVDLVYLYGSPAVGVPGLTNFGGCFPGKRLQTKDGNKWDFVPGISRAAGFEHPMMDFQSLDVKTKKVTTTKCSAAAQALPPSENVDWESDLHERGLYADTILETDLSQFEKAMGWFAHKSAFSGNTAEVKAWADDFGWKVAGVARHNGGLLIGSKQQVWLLQNPKTLDCVVTFQGSIGVKDWLANLGALRDRFCGRPEKVHDGLKYSLELSVRNKNFQNNIRAKLPQCRRVIATGQSQGSAQAEMFTACVNQKPNSDWLYNKMHWTKGTPAKLNYL